MPNPIVIFVRQDRVAALKDKTFPIGLPGKGEMDAPAQARDYAVLLFDDAATSVPASAHRNKDHKAPLLIIAHGGSDHHKPSDIPLQLPKDWGKAFVCETFSHIPGDSIFDEIRKELIPNSGAYAESFGTKRRNKSHLEWCDGLAALCQLAMIDPEQSIAAGDKADPLLANFALEVGNDVLNEPTWEKRLSFVQRIALPFAAGS